MKLYYSPGACSLAPHIALCELGIDHKLEKVDLRTKHYSGGDYRKVNPKGSVPAIELDNGEVLSEAAIILQFLADSKPAAGFLPAAGSWERVRANELLHFVSTEIHKGFGNLWGADRLVPDKTGNEQLRASAKENLVVKIGLISEKLGSKPYLLGEKISAIDCYLYTVLRWSEYLGVDYSKFANVIGYMDRMTSRPKVQQALTAEGLKFAVKG